MRCGGEVQVLSSGEISRMPGGARGHVQNGFRGKLDAGRHLFSMSKQLCRKLLLDVI